MPVGYFTKAHGIRGEISMVLQAESVEILNGLIYVRPRNGGAVKPHTVVRIRRHHGGLLVLLEGVDTRNDAELLRSHTVLVDESKLPALEEDEVYLKDLPGLRVFLASPSSQNGNEPAAGEALGVIREVSSPAGQELWAIVTGEGKEILFPAVDEFVLSIDLKEGRAIIDPPPGLLELYLE